MVDRSWPDPLPFFTKDELACKHCGLLWLNFDFAAALVTLRYLWDKPLVTSSVCRCPDHNADVGGHPRSLHLTENPVHDSNGCAAADIIWENWGVDEKLKFARQAWALGFSLGFNQIFCHIDLRATVNPDMPQHIFHYDNWTEPFADAQVKENAA